MAKRRKSTRRRSTRRRRSLGAVPVYPPTLLATGMPAPALTVGPMLGSPPGDHAVYARTENKKAKKALEEAEVLAGRGYCEGAMDLLMTGAGFFGASVAHQKESGMAVDTDHSAMEHLSKTRAAVHACYIKRS